VRFVVDLGPARDCLCEELEPFRFLRQRNDRGASERNNNRTYGDQRQRPTTPAAVLTLVAVGIPLGWLDAGSASVSNESSR